MTNYEKKFELLGLSVETPKEYESAEQFARNFKRCSILKDTEVTYSSNTYALTQEYKDSLVKIKNLY